VSRTWSSKSLSRIRRVVTFESMCRHACLYASQIPCGPKGLASDSRVASPTRTPDPLVEGPELLLAKAPELRGHVVELEGLLEIVVRDELQVAEADVGKAERDLLRLVGALLEFRRVTRAEMLLHGGVLGEDEVARLEVGLPGLGVLELLRHFGERLVGMFEHAVHRVAEAIAE
jgi:hypothetical protein